MPDLHAAIARELAHTYGEPVTIRSSRALGGGCIAHAEWLETDHGVFFAKSAPGGGDVFEREAEGLDALRASGTSLVIPAVVCFGIDDGQGFLVTDFLERSSRAADFEELLGRGLAELHGASNRAFGFDRDNYCGATPQPNGWLGSWVDFYRERRLGHQLELAVAAGRLGRSDRSALGRLLERLDELLAGSAEGPALIHGDLWSGNLAVAGSLPALVDPAPYFGHREAELGMMTLFGGFGPSVIAAYDESLPLAAGWRERNGLYQLYHLLNHLNLFGGGYGQRAMAIVHHYV